MVKYLFKFKASVENVDKIHFDLSQLEWCLNVDNGYDSEFRENVVVSAKNEVSLPHSRGSTNFLVRWTSATGTLNFLYTHKKVVSYTNQNGEPEVIATVECRNLHPTKIHDIRYGISVTSSSNTEYHDISFTSGEWCEFDEKLVECCRIYDAAWSIESTK